MRKYSIQTLLLAAIGSFLITGCYSHHAAMRQPATVTSPAGEIVVTEPPPEPRKEIVGVAPDERQVWVAGYWVRSGGRWVWVPGHWEVRPRAGAMWVPGHWDKDPSGRGWLWTPGHWN